MTQMSKEVRLEESRIDEITDALVEQGFIHVQHFLPEWLAAQLLQEVIDLASKGLQPAGIGRNDKLQVNTAVRTDSTLWLNGESDTQLAYLAWMKKLKDGLNRRLFMGLFDFECHYSHYAAGDFYKRHVDTFKGDRSIKSSNRVLSTVFYLNADWRESDGGELVLYKEMESSPLLTVPPLYNSCMLFLSERFPHEVVASKCDRYSIAGWFRVNNFFG